MSNLVESLFEALSVCASLHPSASADGGENPFASLGAFGTGLMGVDHSNGSLSETNGAFEDADEAADGVAQLSETGRVRNDYQTPDNRFRPY